MVETLEKASASYAQVITVVEVTRRRAAVAVVEAAVRSGVQITADREIGSFLGSSACSRARIRRVASTRVAIDRVSLPVDGSLDRAWSRLSASRAVISCHEVQLMILSEFIADRAPAVSVGSVREY